MAKIYDFPIKEQKLPQEIEECLFVIADAYIKTLNYALATLSSDNPDQVELEEIRNLVVDSYARGMNKAIEEMEP